MWRLIEINALNLLVAIFAINLLCTILLALHARRTARRNAQLARTLEHHAAVLENITRDGQSGIRKDDASRTEAPAPNPDTAAGDIAQLLAIRNEIESFRAEFRWNESDISVPSGEHAGNPRADKSQ